MPKDKIEEIAEAFARDVGYIPGQEITPIINSLGGQVNPVGWKEWEETDDGSIRVNGLHAKPIFEIFVSNFTGPLRNRFTLAHELGHFVLHSDRGEKQIRAQRSGSTRPEIEANHFAAAFLMPANIFKQVLKNYDGNMRAVAGYFLVSVGAANVRKKILKA